MVFLDEGKPMQKLILCGKEKRGWRDFGRPSYLDQLIAAFSS
jgi:hypothetical protein